MKKTLFLLLAVIAAQLTASAQHEIYPQHFDLGQVTLGDGPLRTSLITNARQLMAYDVDRLLTPFVREAKLSKTSDSQSKYYKWETKHPSFRNWGDPGWTLEGHVGGHYLTALALAYSALQNDLQEQTLATQLKDRLDYCLDILKDCQEAYDGDTEGMEGFIGGQPITQIWKGLYKNDLEPFKQYGGMVPFYCQHKVLAGLRDAYLYTGSDLAKTLYRNLCDWSINVVSNLSENDMQAVLGWEHGGMNEPLADAYLIFGDEKYLTGAKKYSHKTMVDGMQSLNNTFLNYRHANTQVPKYVGFERISQVSSSDARYHTAALNFWKDVTDNRTVCIGGNSVDEHFLDQNSGDKYIANLNGPESCNTNNMLKLTEILFDISHDANYSDYYENAMYNHILSTQDPDTGGYVYFTTLRPQGYKIYSQVDKGMWCCVGTGMENHSKYGHFIYTHDDKNNTLYINLFTASTLNDERYGVTQETTFPYQESTTITVDAAGEYTMALRHPSWVTEGYTVKVNGEEQKVNVRKGRASYVRITRDWQVGDKVEIALPMELRYEPCPCQDEYIAFKYGPVLLAAKTSSGTLPNEYAGEGRMDHAPGSMATNMSVLTSPLLICERSAVLDRITKTGDLEFAIDATRDDAPSDWETLTLQPFFALHHARYMIYWYQQTAEQFANGSLAAEEAARLALDERTIDYVGTGEQQSEAGHQAQYSSNSSYGSYNSEIYRDTQAGGYIQYVLSNEHSDTDLSILCRFTTADHGRVCTIYIDGRKLQDYEIPSSYKPSENGFFNYEIPIPDDLCRDSNGEVKKQLTFKIVASGSTPCPGLYYLRLMKGYNAYYSTNYVFKAGEWANTGDSNRVRQTDISYSEADNTITVRATGTNNVCLNMTQNRYQISSQDKYFIIKGSGLSAADGASMLWWFNGANHGSSVKPTKAVTNDEGDVELYWDLTQSGLDDTVESPTYRFSLGNTIFGLTAPNGVAVIKYIGFNSVAQVPQTAAIDAIRVDGPDACCGQYYNIQGQPVSTPTTPGIYIRQGQKLHVK